MIWPRHPLVQLLDLSIGGVWGSAPGEDEVDVKVARVTELRPNGRLDLSTAASRSITMRQLATRQLCAGDLLLEKSGGGPKTPVGRVGIVTAMEAPTVCANFMQLLRPNTRVVEPKFLHLFLNFFHMTGQTAPLQTASTNIRNIKASDYVRVGVPVPGLAEQRRIVEILEDHLCRLDAGNSELNAVAQRAKLLLKSGLWAATHNLPSSQSVQLDEISSVRLGRQRSPKNHSGDRMRPYLRAANVDWDRLRLDDILEMNFTESEELTYRLQAGDILLTEASGSPREVGKSVLYIGVPKDVCFQNTLLRVRAHAADPEFLQKYLLAEAHAGRFMPAARGVGINHLGRAKLAALKVELPTPETQAASVAQCRDLIGRVEALNAAVEIAQKRAANMRRAVLAAAFSGKLTGRHTDDELIEEIAEAGA